MSRRRPAGFTLLELAISLAVATLLFLLAAQLLRAAHLVFLDAGREAIDPEPRLAAAMLRRDVRESIGAAPAAAPDDPLVLYLPGGGSVRYERDGPQLLRIRLDAGGGEVSRRVALAPLAAWSWREPQPGLLEVTLVTVDHPMTRSLQVAHPERLAAAPQPVVTRVLASRRLGRRGW